MPSVTYIEHGGTEHRVAVESGMTVMEGAQLNTVPGIEAVCGGLCSCATCHCYIDGTERIDRTRNNFRTTSLRHL